MSILVSCFLYVYPYKKILFEMNGKNKNKIFLGFIDRDKPLTWILAIIIAMLTVPLVVTLVLYYTM